MPPIHEFQCSKEDCPNKTAIIEKWVIPDEKVYCEICDNPLKKLISASSHVFTKKEWWMKK